MKVAIFSDTYGMLPETKGSYDLAIHCGNFCPPALSPLDNLHSQVTWLHEKFKPWIESIDAPHKIIVPGYFDIAARYLEPHFEYHLDAIYLSDSCTTIEGRTIYGMPWVPDLMKNMVPPDSIFVSRNYEIYKAAINKIPDETSILITRIPPQGILDGLGQVSIGDPFLLDKVRSLHNLEMHFFGYAADHGGRYIVHDDVIFANGCIPYGGYLEVTV